MLKKLQLTILFIMVISLTIFFFVFEEQSDNITSAYIVDGLNQATPIKILVTEYYATHGTFPDQNSEIELPAPAELSGNSIKSIEVSMGGRITITYNKKVKQNASIVLIPEPTYSRISSTLEWSCVSTTIKQKYFDNLVPGCSYQQPTKIHALITVIQRNDFEAFTEILAGKVDVNDNVLGYTPIMTAIRQGIPSYIDALVKRGADINARSDKFHGMTPLMYAARIGQAHAVRKLISLEADINAQDENGMTALMHAAQRSHQEAVELLLNFGAAWGLRDETGRSALDYYPKSGKHTHGYILLAKYAGLATNDTTATVPSSPRTIVALSEFSRAAQEGDQTRLLELIRSGADINQRDIKGATALHYATLAGQNEIVSMLISHGADTNVQCTELETPLILAIRNNNIEMAQRLISHGASDKTRGSLDITPLMLAAKLGHAEIVEMILKSGTTTAESRHSALYEALTNAATRKSRIEIQHSLIQSKIDLNQHQANQIPFLILAANAGNQTVVEAMLRRGANPKIKNSQTNETALHSAAEHDFTGIATLLLSAGADKNAANNEGDTPLITAVKNKHYRMANLLLKAGVDVNTTNKNGMTAFAIARALYYDDLLNLLRSYRDKR